MKVVTYSPNTGEKLCTFAFSPIVVENQRVLPRLNVHNIPPYRTTAAEAFISSSAVVQEGSPKDQ